MKRKELWQRRQATLIYNYYLTLFIRWILDIRVATKPSSVINLPTPDHCPHFIAIEMFRESDKVSGISRCCSYVSSLCVFSAYFLDLILLLAKVIMLLCIRYTVQGVPFATSLKLCPWWVVQPPASIISSTLYTWVSWAVTAAFVLQFCFALLLTCFIRISIIFYARRHCRRRPRRHLAYIYCFCQLFAVCRPPSHTDIIKQVEKVGVKDTRLLDTTHSVLPNPGLIASRRETW